MERPPRGPRRTHVSRLRARLAKLTQRSIDTYLRHSLLMLPRTKVRLLHLTKSAPKPGLPVLLGVAIEYAAIALTSRKRVQEAVSCVRIVFVNKRVSSPDPLGTCHLRLDATIQCQIKDSTCSWCSGGPSSISSAAVSTFNRSRPALPVTSGLLSEIQVKDRTIVAVRPRTGWAPYFEELLRGVASLERETRVFRAIPIQPSQVRLSYRLVDVA